ncbi:CRISPR-associated CARF protein Csa3 [Acidilobus sp.]|uniref:CRISPR-associated CARF protein Csa3 n=1 Tax=Acidilobus sp. TaxID=1872109 RepID=UPI003CFE73E8
MEQLLISTLGFTESHVIRALHRYSIGSGDRVIMVSSDRTSGVLKAYQSAVATATTIGVRHDDIELLIVDPSGPLSVARDVLGRVEALNERPRRVIIGLGGGLRVLVVGTFIAGLLLARSSLNVRAYIASEAGTGDESELDYSVLEAVLGLGDPELKYLTAILRLSGGGREPTPDDVASELNVSRKTALNSLARLKELGLASQAGRSGGLKLTEAGELSVIMARLSEKMSHNDPGAGSSSGS